MVDKNITNQARELLIKAEAKLAEKRQRELVEAIKGIKIESKVVINPPEITMPPFPEITIPKIDFPPMPKQEIVVKQEPIEVPDIDTSGLEKTLREVLGKFKLPKPEVIVNVPPIKTGEMKWPVGNMPIEGLITLKGVDKSNPLPVELRDADGKPLRWPEFVGNGNGGGRSIARIGGIDASAWGEILTPDGRLRTDGGGSSGGGLTDTELRASHLDVQQLSGSTDSVNIVSSVTLDVKQVSGSEDSVVVNNTVPVLQLSGSEFSVVINNAPDVRQVSGAEYSVVVNNTVPVIQASGAINSVNVVQVNGQTPSLNNGDADAGTLRTVLAKSANATTTSVNVGADASTNIALTNLNRKSIAITHNSNANLYVATGTAASTTSFPIVTNQIIIFDDYVGPVNAIAEEQAGTISVRYIEID